MQYLLTFGPLLLAMAAWAKIYWQRPVDRPSRFPRTALAVASANALFAAGTLLYFRIRPTSPALPPWQDPAILNLGLLFLFAPIGAVLGIVAAARNAPGWLVLVTELMSIPLFLLGLLAGAAV